MNNITPPPVSTTTQTLHSVRRHVEYLYVSVRRLRPARSRLRPARSRLRPARRRLRPARRRGDASAVVLTLLSLKDSLTASIH